MPGRVALVLQFVSSLLKPDHLEEAVGLRFRVTVGIRSKIVVYRGRNLRFSWFTLASNAMRQHVPSVYEPGLYSIAAMGTPNA